MIGEPYISLLVFASLEVRSQTVAGALPPADLESTGQRRDGGQRMASAERRPTRIYLACQSSCQGRFHGTFMKSQLVSWCKPIEPLVQTRHSLKFQERDHIEFDGVS